jgi:pyruvate dehydrogenase E2 component (dihydrolipoamide acetyltransferase)
MQDATILSWLIDDGQPVGEGEELVEIETDKATMTHPAEVEGVLEVVVPAGETVPVGTLIARIGAPVADGPSAADGLPTAPAGLTAPEGSPAAPVRATAPAGPGGASAAEPSASRRQLVTPLASRLARAHDVSLQGVAGTGPRARITRGDVLNAAGVAQPATPRQAPAGQTQELSRTQRVIARRMAEAKATVPEFQVQAEVSIDAAVALRDELKQIAAADVVPSLNDMIVKACAIALRAHPRANGSYRDGRFELHERVNVGIAVAADDALVVPTLPDADAKSLSQIARESRLLAERVRSGEITPPELSGATFTVSNLGMFGMSAITPVINPPQAAILGVGTLRESLARSAGEIVDRTLVTLTLTCDHRILYGADAARLLSDVRDTLERPLKLVL